MQVEVIYAAIVQKSILHSGNVDVRLILTEGAWGTNFISNTRAHSYIRDQTPPLGKLF